MMKKKIFALTAFLLVFGALFSGVASALHVVSINDVIVNNRFLAEGKTNLIEQDNFLSVSAALNGITVSNKLSVEAVLTDMKTGNTVADSTGNFTLQAGQSFVALLNLDLLGMPNTQKDFRLLIKATGDNGKTDQKSYDIRLSDGLGDSGSFKVSIDRVRTNGQLVVTSATNFIQEASQMDVQIELTSIGDIKDGRVEAILKDLRTGVAVAEATGNLNIPGRLSFGASLQLDLIDPLDDSDSFELTVRIIDAEGHSNSQAYKLRMKDGFAGGNGRDLDVSIDSVRVNGQVIAESKNNLVEEDDSFRINVEFTPLEDLDDVRTEAILKDLRSGNVVADTTFNQDFPKNNTFSSFMFLDLIDPLDDSDSFELTIRMIDTEGHSIQKIYGIRMKDGSGSNRQGSGGLDTSIDRVKVNGKIVAASKTNFIDENDDFGVVVEFTALEELENARVEVTLKDLASGSVVADATPNFRAFDGESLSKTLKLELIDSLKKSSSFELTVRIEEAEGSSIQKIYGIRMKNGNGAANGANGNAASRGDLDISIDSVEVESKAITEDENNFILIGEGKKDIDLRIRLTSLENIENARVEAVLFFENGDVVSDKTANFNLVKDASTVKKVELPLISMFEQGAFRLRLRVIDAEGDFEERSYGLKLSQKRFPFLITGISLSTEGNAEAGKVIGVLLKFRNIGITAAEGMTARVSIPELGVSSTKFVEQIKSSGSEMKDEFMLKIPAQTQTGTYTIRSEIISQFGGESELKEIPLPVTGKSEQIKQFAADKLVINVPVAKQDMGKGAEAVYPIILTNEGSESNTYTLLLDGMGWAALRLSDSSAFVINPKESKTVNVYASLKNSVRGEQTFSVSVASNEKVLKQISLKADVLAGKEGASADLKEILVVALIVLVIALAAVGLFFGIKRYVQGSESKESAEEEIESYY